MAELSSPKTPPYEFDEFVRNYLLDVSLCELQRTSEGEIMCPICQMDWNKQEAIVRTDLCNHIFHKACILCWLRSTNIAGFMNQTCPQCRRKLYFNPESAEQEEVESYEEGEIVGSEEGEIIDQEGEIIDQEGEIIDQEGEIVDSERQFFDGDFFYQQCVAMRGLVSDAMEMARSLEGPHKGCIIEAIELIIGIVMPRWPTNSVWDGYEDTVERLSTLAMEQFIIAQMMCLASDWRFLRWNDVFPITPYQYTRLLQHCRARFADLHLAATEMADQYQNNSVTVIWSLRTLFPHRSRHHSPMSLLLTQYDAENEQSGQFRVNCDTIDIAEPEWGGYLEAGRLIVSYNHARRENDLLIILMDSFPGHLESIEVSETPSSGMVVFRNLNGWTAVLTFDFTEDYYPMEELFEPSLFD